MIRRRGLAALPSRAGGGRGRMTAGRRLCPGAVIGTGAHPQHPQHLSA